MPAHEQNLIWIDLEMTGLEPDRHVIVEIATIITDDDLELIAEGPDLVLSVEDDGVGFRTGDPRKPQSLGLVGLLTNRVGRRRDLRGSGPDGGRARRYRLRLPQPAGAARGRWRRRRPGW